MLGILPKIKGLYRRDYAKHMDFDGTEDTEIDAVLLTHGTASTVKRRRVQYPVIVRPRSFVCSNFW